MNDRGLSPIIAVIMMVAIVTILAAVIAALLFGYASVTADNTPRPSAFELGLADGRNGTWIDRPGTWAPDYMAGFQTGYVSRYSSCSCNCSGGLP
jgi:flagellin-like protein